VHAELREARALKQEWTTQTATWTEQAAARDAALGEATSEVERLHAELAAAQAEHASALKTATDELQHANAVHETAIKHANTEFARVNSERLRLRMELSAVPEETVAPPPLPPPKPPVPAEPMIPRREHEAKLAEAAAKASAKLREVQTAHGDELRDVRKKVSAEWFMKERTKVAQATTDKQYALEKQRKDLREAADVQREKEEAKAKEARVDLIAKQTARRMKYRDLSRGWTAWAEVWAAHVHQTATLRHVASRLAAPALSKAFAWWLQDLNEHLRDEEAKALLKASADLEDQLRASKYENAQLTLVNAAHEDELIGLRQKVAVQGGEIADKTAALAKQAATNRESG